MAELTCHGEIFQSDKMPIKFIDAEGVGQIAVVRKRGIRSMRLHVNGHGVVRLTLPWWVSIAHGLEFVSSKSDWINSQQRAAIFVPNSGMKFGKELELYINNAKIKRPRKQLHGNILTVSIPDNLLQTDEKATDYIIKSMTWALRTQAEDLLIPRIQELARIHDFSYASCSVKQLKSRWGSCNHKHDIVLNLYLIQLPWELIDYVLLHELNHTKHLYHGPVFWQALENVCPSAKDYRKRLKPYLPRLYDARESINLMA